METNPQIELARRYVEQTGVSVFLTGKAGTGKTTFLHELAATTSKRHAIVAPTGVAAINAGGVTIHSFFQLPFDPYLPDVKELLTEYQMPDRYKALNKTKQNIIRTLELLIIDEVSMVRADLLDAIDMTLRRVRRSSRPFGGVQLLMIGDVHQLAPVVTEAERPYMERVYPTPYFFASKALQQLPYVTIELTTVFRQQDAAFVDLLNHVRDNRLDAETLRKLNARAENGERRTENNTCASPLSTLHTPPSIPITLTTHNRQADAINRRHLDALTGERRTFEAILTGNYPEKALPCNRALEVKVGERVMFVKNDSSGAHRYYNGMLATVTSLTPAPPPIGEGSEEPLIEVVSDDGDIIDVGRENWESLRYTLDEESGTITQEVEGTFSQYPLQAAWAVTIHKAQGLTFDRVVIDAADAFAFGQVYVALSRCRSLEGLTLSTPLGAGVAFNDSAVTQFVDRQPTFEQTAQAADAYEQQYRLEKLMELFGIDDLVHLAGRLGSLYAKLRNLYPANVERMHLVEQTLATLQGVSERFKTQLMRLDERQQNERAAKGADHYRQQLGAARSCYAVLLDVKIDNKENAKAVREAGKALLEALDLKLACLDAVLREGYSVATVQRAKAAALVKTENGERRTENGKRRAENGKSRTRPKGANGLSTENGKRRAGKNNNPDSLADLETLLRRWRSAKAKELDIPVYMVLQQKALLAIVADPPATADELRALPWIGDRTVERFGQELLDLVAGFIESGQ